MSSCSQTIPKERLFVTATFPFLASDCNSFPLHFQLTCSYKNSWYIYYSPQMKGNKRTKSGRWGWSFLGSSATGKKEFFCQLHSCCLSPIIICSSPHLNLLVPSVAPVQLFSSWVLAVWDEHNCFFFFFRIDYWLCLQGKVVSPMYLYISKASLYKQSCSLSYIAFLTSAKIYYASESNFRYVFACICCFAGANIFITECSSSSLFSI